MSAGFRNPDLSAIHPLPWDATCTVTRCTFEVRAEWGVTKAGVLRRARRHAAETGHMLRLYGHSYQDVTPPPGR